MATRSTPPAAAQPAAPPTAAQPAATAEAAAQPAQPGTGVPYPQPIEAVPANAVAPTEPPTVEDYQREWGTYRAKQTLYIGTAAVVPAGGPVPVSHPLREQWDADGLIERVDGGSDQQSAQE